MSAPLSWDELGGRWPWREASRFVEAGGLRWHVQIWEEGEEARGSLLLLHGSGGSTHSWAALAPRLAEAGWGLVLPDLPGHAFTERPDDEGLTLEGFTRAVGRLVEALDRRVVAVVGHSAGASVALELARAQGDGLPVVGVCPALVAGREIPRATPSFLAAGFKSRFAARFAAGLVRNTGGLRRVLRSTGSRVPEPSERLYRLLAGNADHVNTTLSLFSNWDPVAVERGLETVDTPILLLAGGADGWIPVSDVEKAAELLPRASVRVLEGLGHLAHEEAASRVAHAMVSWLEDHAATSSA